MTKFVFRSPGKYIQGQNILEDIGKEVHVLGSHPLILSDKMVWDLTQETIKKSFKQTSLSYSYIEFKGEASQDEILRLAEEGRRVSTDFIIGLGGGKTLDTAKAVADELSIPVAIIPTIASTDAPTSALSVIYTEEGTFESYKFYDKNPDIVLVDTQVVVNAPAHLFASGMADAMATLVEAQAANQSNALAMAGGQATLAAKAICKMAEETLFTHGEMAYRAVKKKLVTPQVEAVVEANTLLSGLGFENGGLAAAHAIHNGFTALDGEIHSLTHGEKVAYGTLVQLVLEGRSFAEIERYLAFYEAIGMPTTLKDLNVADKSYADFVKIGTLAVSENETLKNLSSSITAENVADAILAVDVLATEIRQTF